MPRPANPQAREAAKLRQELDQYRTDFSRIDTEVSSHKTAVSACEARRQYLQDLIQAKERMIARYTRLAAARPPAIRGRRPGRPPKARKPVEKARRRRVRRVEAPRAATATSQRYADLLVTDAAEQVLKAAGKPIHLKEITAQLIAGGKAFRAKKPENSIQTMMAKDKRFRNMGRNMWALA